MEPTKPPDRRREALSRARIVEEAIRLLDVAGESGLTFRALTKRLSTGAGAIYWHVANRDELLAAATEEVLGGAVFADLAQAAPEEAIRALAGSVFDTLDAHPWIGVQLSRTPWQPAMVQIFERVGRGLEALGVPENAQFTSASVLWNYILGVGGQNAANARIEVQEASRSDFLDVVARAWSELDADEFPFTRKAALELRDHDDRVQFLDGIDLILAGITARS